MEKALLIKSVNVEYLLTLGSPRNYYHIKKRIIKGYLQIKEGSI